MGLDWEPRNDKETMYFVFVIKGTSPSPVAIVKSHGTKCQNYFRVTISTIADAREERNQGKDDEL